MDRSTIAKLFAIVIFGIVILTKVSPLLFKSAFPVPPLTGRVVDAGKVFTEEEQERIENAIIKLEEETGGQMVVTTLPSLNGHSIEEVGLSLGNEWGIGYEGKDNGAILIIVVPERQMRLEVGIGWEKPISDERADYVIRHLTPFFKDGKYADGSVWAVERVQQYVTGNKVEHSVNVPNVNVPKNTDAKTDNGNTNSGNGYSIMEIIGLIIVLVLSLFAKGDPKDRLKRSSSSSGGFSGGGGHFGGHGSSGRW